MILPVIMAGGTGSRLWPMSRAHFPKQFLKLCGNHSMLQDTINRLNNFNELQVADPIVICNEAHKHIVAEQLLEINKKPGHIILEPNGRNTAPAIALAAINAIEHGLDPVMLVLAADHIINNIPEFLLTIRMAYPFACTKYLTTFGIVSREPETGYGYILRGQLLENSLDVYKVKQFVEKPDLATAKAYVASGNYYWNSGMFMFKASVYLQELELYHPEIVKSCREALRLAKRENYFVLIDEKTFNRCPDLSVDYAVMEKTDNAVVIPLDAEWSDVGCWSALWQISLKDNNNNVIIGDVYLADSNNCYINGSGKFIAAIGINNLVIVNSNDSILIIDKSNTQDVKKIVEHLKLKNNKEHHQADVICNAWNKNNVKFLQCKYRNNKLQIKTG